MADSTPTLDGYIRVSTVRDREGPSFISPDVQREQIAQWARLRGVTIAEWHTDLDQTGGKLSRPGLDRVLARIRDHQTGGIAVARLDRLSRAGVGDALKLVEELADHGAQLAAIDLGIDPTTPFGEFALTIMLALARMERRRITESWRTAREHAVARGVHIASATPTGYLRGADGRLEPNPVFADAIREVFRRRARGDSWRQLARYLDEQGVQGPYGASAWRTRAVQHMVANPVYLGRAYSGEFVNRDAHEPLIDRVTWQAAQAARGAPVSRGEPALLAGLLRCAGCRYLLKPDRMTVRDGERVRIYRCRGEHASGTCESRAAVLGSVIEPWVQQQFLERVDGLAARAQSEVVGLDDAERTLADAEAELVAFRDDERILGVLGQDRFVEGLTSRARAVDRAQGHVDDLRSAMTPAALPTLDIRGVWGELDVEERRKIMRSVIDCVVLRSVGRSNVAIADRSLVLWHGQAPDDLPRRGVRVPLRPFVWPVDDLPAHVGVPVVQDAEEGAL